VDVPEAAQSLFDVRFCKIFLVPEFFLPLLLIEKELPADSLFLPVDLRPERRFKQAVEVSGPNRNRESITEVRNRKSLRASRLHS